MFSTLNTKGAAKGFKNLLKDLKKRNVAKELENAQRGTVEKNVKNRLTAFEYLSHLSLNTWPTTGKYTDVIKKNINTKVIKKGDEIFIGTGRISLMDSKDVIKKFRNPKRILKKNYRLWRILQFGTKGNYVIKPRVKSILKWRNPYTYKNSLRGRINLRKSNTVYRKKVIHPGVHGRFYFMTQDGKMYERDKIMMYYKTSKILEKVVRKHSFE